MSDIAIWTVCAMFSHGVCAQVDKGDYPPIVILLTCAIAWPICLGGAIGKILTRCK